MRRFIITVLATLLLIAGAVSVRAAEDPAFEAGIRMWWNKWERDVPGLGEVTSDGALLLGPEITAKFGNNLFLEASYLFSAADYEFGNGASDFERQDVQAVLGYSFIPEFSVSAGYRTLWFEDDAAGREETVYGPILGVRGLAPLSGEKLVLYAKADYQFTRFKEEDEFGSAREDSPGWIAELGLEFSFTPQVSAAFGYQYETTKGEDSDVRDTFYGPTIDVLFSF